jgi:ribosome-associated heat shock protein Hsp15
VSDDVRIDKWLWAARFFKTRSQATAAVEAGHVKWKGERVKPARHVAPGDLLEIRTPGGLFIVVIKALGERRGSAQAAQALYDETPDSRAAREAERERTRRFADPAREIFARPTKRDRRDLDRFRGG